MKTAAHYRKYRREWARAHKEQRREATRRWRKKNPQKVREYGRISYARRYAEKRAYLNAEKNFPCADCGIKYPPYVMQFDHVRGRKLLTIGRKIINVAWAKIVREIKKCDVVCSNCHAERTHGK